MTLFRRHFGVVIFGGSLLLSLSAAAAAERGWEVDAKHTHVGFSVPHMMVSEVEGQFRTFSGVVRLDDSDPTKSVMNLSIEVASIDTGDTDRDSHLKNADFFDAEKYPKVTFTSTKVLRAKDGYKVHGKISIHGVTRDVVLNATLSEPITNLSGKQMRASRITGKLNRKDFGLTWNKALDKGGVAVGDEVSIDIKAELVQ